MILPTKHITNERSLLGVGADIIAIIQKRPETISSIWNKIRQKKKKTPISYRWFILSLDLLYIMGAIKIEQGLIRLASKC
ncbi:ABC-three component system middle component 6 [Commensalibacter oyaizuii]|uniref:Uncharacterized protein n=1 Tax=Commensalibacter oyaizuii TaxID=3043873 RepID=A0ABT6Q520_9PROT|nr:ABC-three component system middle component 6 [Commensalibacter sp. TBRC 16381]MDI2091646.1 hypothetical protein [Commensalibacter sp. TBRC 16381]